MARRSLPLWPVVVGLVATVAVLLPGKKKVTKPPPTEPGGAVNPDLIAVVPPSPGASAKIGDTVEVRKDRIVGPNLFVHPIGTPGSTVMQMLVTGIIPELWRAPTGPTLDNPSGGALVGPGLEGTVTALLTIPPFGGEGVASAVTPTPKATIFRRDATRVLAVPPPPREPILTQPPWLKL